MGGKKPKNGNPVVLVAAVSQAVPDGLVNHTPAPYGRNAGTTRERAQGEHSDRPRPKHRKIFSDRPFPAGTLPEILSVETSLYTSPASSQDHDYFSDTEFLQ